MHDIFAHPKGVKMKNILILITICFSVFSMEQPNKFSIKLYGTTIDVSTKFLSNIINIDLFVAGSHEQESLDSSAIINYIPGTISYQEHMYWENKDHESSYRDNTWEFFGHENQSKKAQKIS